MANPQPDQFTKLSNELYEAIMKTDFTKRQRNIIDLIVRLSYGCRKKFAILRPSDFEVVGVLRGHIKRELEFLQLVNVLHIEGEIYTLNKDYDSWRVSITKGFNAEKYQKILSRNIENVVTETVTKVTESVTNVTEMVTNQPREIVTELVTNVTETVTIENKELPKQELYSYQNSNTPVTKTVTGMCLEPNQDAASGVRKDSIKESIKDSSTSNKVVPIFKDQSGSHHNGNADFSFSRIYQAYEKNFTRDGRVTDFEIEELNILFDDFGGEWLLKAMRETFRQEPDKRKLSYVHGVLKGYKSRGGPEAELSSGSGNSPPALQCYVPDDDITRRMREADKLYAQHGAT